MMSSGDARFFTSHKKGEIAEFRDEIANPDKDKKKDAVKKVIAAMTVGKDVSMLFTDVVNCMQTENVELKKLVYLYLINYAKTQPDLAILAVNTFVKDTQDPNPLIRALAVRTMGCIRVDKITEYLCDPLQRSLSDEDPYVRKTAAICVAKLFDLNQELVEDRGFVDQLRDLLADGNPMVVANAVAALAEIRESSRNPNDVFRLDTNTVYKLLAALNECTEWGQVFILDSLSSYVAQDERDAESVIERVTPRLQHANCAVVLSAVKVIISQLQWILNPDTSTSLVRKLAPPLVTLLSAEAEIQYVALRNINLIIQRYPEVLQYEIKVFFCKYNDPIFVKQEKLETMVKLAAEQNIDQVLLEFKEYATEVDVDFVRKSVRAIGRCAISIENAAERCINVLLELIGTRVNYVVQEAIVVIKDIFRRYPNQYEGVIGALCDSLETLDEPEAKASMVWIIGEYAERIDNAEELLEAFLDNFLDEASEVQLQLLTATVKLFLKKPSSGPQSLIQMVLQQATTDTDDPDLRDRAYIYWRLLSSDPEAAKEVVLASKPMIRDDRNTLDADLLNQLLHQISTLSSVYYKLPAVFVPRSRISLDEDDEHTGDTVTSRSPEVLSKPPTQPLTKEAGVDLLADLMDGVNVAVPAAALRGGGHVTNISASEATLSSTSYQMRPFHGANEAPSQLPSRVLLSSEKGAGLEISGVVIQGPENTPLYSLTFTNGTQTPLDGFQLQFNKNPFSLAPLNQPHIETIGPGQNGSCLIPLSFSGQSSGGTVSSLLQVAVKSPKQNQAVFYFNDYVPLEALLLNTGPMDKNSFTRDWQTNPETQKQIQVSRTMLDVDTAASTLIANRWCLISRRTVDETKQTLLYLSAKLPGPQQEFWLPVEITFAPSAHTLKVAVRSSVQGLAEMVFSSLERTFM